MSMIKIKQIIILFGALLLSQQMLGSISGRTILTAYNELLGVPPLEEVVLLFPYNLHPDYVATSTVVPTGGSASVTSSTNFALLSAVAGTAGALASATLDSKRSVHHYTGFGTSAIVGCFFTAGVANTVQQIGIGGTKNGFFFGYNGATFGITHRINFVDTFIPQSSWNGDIMNGTGASGVTLDPTKGNVYKIQYQWPFGVIKFYIEKPSDGSWILVHTIAYGNAYTDASLTSPSQELYAFVSNSVVSTPPTITLSVSNMSGFVEGTVNKGLDTQHSISNSSVATFNTTLQSLLAIRNNTTIQSRTNHLAIILDAMTMIQSGAVALQYSLILNPTTTLTFPSSINPVTSMVSYDTALSTVTGGTVLATFFLDAASTEYMELAETPIMLAPGDVVVVAVRTMTGNSATIKGVALRWLERF